MNGHPFAPPSFPIGDRPSRLRPHSLNSKGEPMPRSQRQEPTERPRNKAETRRKILDHSLPDSSIEGWAKLLLRAFRDHHQHPISQ